MVRVLRDKFEDVKMAGWLSCSNSGSVVQLNNLFLCTSYCWEDQGVGGKMGSEWILGRLGWGGGVWIGFDCLRTGTGGGLL
jgi:hypothetical protein